MRVYMPGEEWDAGDFPRLLAIGDSWFWYPKNNILESIIRAPSVKDPYTTIQALGYNGADIGQFVGNGKYAKSFHYELEKGSQYYEAILISGGGNDAVDYGLTLKKDCRRFSTAEQCMDPAGLDNLLRIISGSVGLMIHDIRWAFNKHNKSAKILLHGYDYPVPDGRGFHIKDRKMAGPWLKPALDAAKVDSDNMPLRLSICRHLIDMLYITLARFERPSEGIFCINSRGTLRDGPDYKKDWDNELHPTPSGFRKIVDKCWVPVLRSIGYAKA